MKSKIIMGIIIAILVVVVAVEGVIIFNHSKEDRNVETPIEQPKENVEDTPSAKPVVTQTPKPAQEIKGERLTITKKYNEPKDDELVYAYIDARIIENEDKNKTEYKYRIPQINIDSSDVQAINDEIIIKFTNKYDEMIEQQVLYELVEYKYFVNGDILSLIIIYDNWMSAQYFSSDIYNINISTGKQVNSNELLKYLNITEEEFREKLINVIKNSPDYKEPYDEEATTKKCDETIKMYEEMPINEMQLYISTDGNIAAYIYVNAVAGGEFSYYLMQLETGELDWDGVDVTV